MSQEQENKQKIRIGLIFGGRSEEHEVSLTSANSVMANLDKDKIEANCGIFTIFQSSLPL